MQGFGKEIPQLEEIAGKTWKKEEELKVLKAELAALDRKIQLELAPPQEQGTNENTICLCRKGIYELMVESSSTTMALI